MRLGELVDFHFLRGLASDRELGLLGGAYHFECVEFLLDLLRENGRQAITGCNLTATVILGTRPNIVELNARAEANVAGA